MGFNKTAIKKAALAAGCMGMLLAMGLPITGFAPDAKKGKAVFDENCSACHKPDSTETLVGPGLKGLFKKAKLASGKAVSEMAIRDIINKGGDVMPGFGDMLTAAQKDDVVAYLKTL
jgi:mono/diheme cytochrome c family protein